MYWINVVSFNNTTKNTPLFSSLIPFSYCLIARIHCHPMIQKTLLLNYHSVLWVSISGKYIFGLCFCHVAPFIEHVSFKEKLNRRKTIAAKNLDMTFWHFPQQLDQIIPLLMEIHVLKIIKMALVQWRRIQLDFTWQKQK